MYSNTFSDWTTLIAGLPQGTWLGPLLFIGLINDLGTYLSLHKYVDDVTMTEILEQHAAHSVMQNACDEVENWSKVHHMNIKPKKDETNDLWPAGRQTANKFNYFRSQYRTREPIQITRRDSNGHIEVGRAY